MTKPSPAERIVHILTEMYYEKQRITQTATSLAPRGVAATISYFDFGAREGGSARGPWAWQRRGWMNAATGWIERTVQPAAGLASPWTGGGPARLQIRPSSARTMGQQLDMPYYHPMRAGSGGGVPGVRSRHPSLTGHSSELLAASGQPSAHPQHPLPLAL